MKIFRIKGSVQNYAWGGNHFIPNLLGVQNADNQPFAEIWFGAHQRGPAQLENNQDDQNLIEWLEKNPSALGEEVTQKFGNRLPYLLKVLDVNKMLSIQTHPTKSAAEIGFARENKDGIPLTAFHRNYKDDNHKPEVMVALTDFWLLHGFKSEDTIESSLASVPEFASLLEYFQRIRSREVENKIYHFYKNVMEMPQDQVDEILEKLEERLSHEMKQQNIKKYSSNWWAALAFANREKGKPHDRGVFSIYILNLLNLKTGEGIFQDAGIPHAYLKGVNVELMANSDNVFRGGLTVKHIDVRELLENVIFEPVVPKILKGKNIGKGIKVYPTPAPDFELTRITLGDFQVFYSKKVNSPEILILLKGEVIVTDDEQEFRLQKGDSFFVPCGSKYRLLSDGVSVLFKASVPVE